MEVMHRNNPAYYLRLEACLIIDQEEFDLKICNPNVLGNNTGGYISKYLYINVHLNGEIPSNSKVTIRAYKKVKDGLRFTGINIAVTIPEVLRMDAFDLQNLFNNCFKPPFKWPLKKGACLIIDQEEFNLQTYNPNVVGNNTRGYISKYLHVNVSLNADIPSNSKVTIKVYKKVKDGLRFTGINIAVTMIEVLRMEAFDLQNLFVNCFKPPLKWPLKKGGFYQCKGWDPDAEKFPKALPSGHYKLEVAYYLPDKSKFAECYWIIHMHD
ncbi:hypothetical protein FQR65_LT08930 [Abscondita terminalis]|nr:hypothetical protein FQR65_LT08930 [Abscondita terminalis]